MDENRLPLTDTERIVTNVSKQEKKIQVGKERALCNSVNTLVLKRKILQPKFDNNTFCSMEDHDHSKPKKMKLELASSISEEIDENSCPESPDLQNNCAYMTEWVKFINKNKKRKSEVNDTTNKPGTCKPALNSRRRLCFNSVDNIEEFNDNPANVLWKNFASKD